MLQLIVRRRSPKHILDYLSHLPGLDRFGVTMTRKLATLPLNRCPGCKTGPLSRLSEYYSLGKLCPGCLSSGGNSCKSHKLPSRSPKPAYFTPPKSVISPTSTPCFTSA